MPHLASDSLSILRANRLFAQLDEAVLASINERLSWITVRGGEVLFHAGEPARYLYLLHSGSLGLFRRPQAGGTMHLAGILGAGDAAGVIGLLLDRAHDISARALRDSELLCLSREDYAHLLDRHPRAIVDSARAALQRLLARGGSEPRIVPRTFALLPFDAAVPARDTAETLRAQLAPFGDCVLIDHAAGRGRDPAWFSEREHEARFVLYLDEGRDAAWRALCRRQADALLWLAEAGRAPRPWPGSGATGQRDDDARPRHLLLLQPSQNIVAGAARGWSHSLDGTAQVHHVRHDLDLARVARLLARRSTGLVLSGGGARGFAAIGLLRALREGGFKIDRVGGTSMGAIMAAGIAMEWDDQAMVEHFRAAFVERRPLSDWTLPLVALLRGRRASRLLQRYFGLGDIEDLPLPFFCVSADLTSGQSRTHRQGPLWHGLRAASSLPGMLPPVLHRGHVLVDGAVMNNLPVDVMYDHGVSVILACDIRAEGVLTTELERAWSPGIWQQWRQRRQRPGLASVLLRSGMVNAQATADHRMRLATRVFSPPLEGVGLLDFDQFDRAVEAGYRHGVEQLERGHVQ